MNPQIKGAIKSLGGVLAVENAVIPYAVGVDIATRPDGIAELAAGRIPGSFVTFAAGRRPRATEYLYE